ncbi:MAG: FAD-binding protein [Candidatus Nezhaarchaeota archaeon]|nr:FAD-binding protein [Candidatus Nezhaarchaeota archaeon]
MRVKKIETDVLVIGGGAAGMRAAIAARDLGAEVVLLDKGVIGRSGTSGTLPYWNVSAPLVPEDRDKYFNDLMKRSHGLANPRLLKVLVEEAGNVVAELEDFGNIFLRDALGNVSPAHANGHSEARVLTPAYSWVMSMQLFKRGVKVFDETFVASLIKHEERIAGALAINLKDGGLLVVKSKATILATGGFGHIFGMSSRPWRSANPIELTGDGHALAYEVGAELVDMEFHQVVLESQYASLVGQTFISTALALARALRSSTTFDEAPSLHHCLGGVVIDDHGRTNVPGLYACGEVAGGLHLRSTDQLIGCLVFGKRAGESAAKEALSVDLPNELVEREVNKVLSVLRNSPRDPILPLELKRRLANVMWEKVALVKTEESLRDALKAVYEIKNLLPRMYVRDKSMLFNKEWIEALEVYNMVTVAEMVIRASLLRRESRGVFKRVDYPNSDDRYLGNFYVKKVNGEMVLEFRPSLVNSAKQPCVVIASKDGI